MHPAKARLFECCCRAQDTDKSFGRDPVALAVRIQPRSATILVVEDEELLRLSVSKALRKRKFSVVEASDGSAAMDLICANTEGITFDRT